LAAHDADLPCSGSAVLQHSDDPVIEPGELLVRVIIEAPEDMDGQQQALEMFERTHDAAIKQFRSDLPGQLRGTWRLEFCTSEAADGPLMLQEAAAPEGTGLTPVMARLGPVDLDTLDALITAGIAASRAEAVRARCRASVPGQRHSQRRRSPQATPAT
jgi:hypothetical protein